MAEKTGRRVTRPATIALGTFYSGERDVVGIRNAFAERFGSHFDEHEGAQWNSDTDQRMVRVEQRHWTVLLGPRSVASGHGDELFNDIAAWLLDAYKEPAPERFNLQFEEQATVDDSPRATRRLSSYATAMPKRAKMGLLWSWRYRRLHWTFVMHPPQFPRCHFSVLASGDGAPSLPLPIKQLMGYVDGLVGKHLHILVDGGAS